LRDYELVIIISPDVAEEDIPTTIDKVSQFVTSRGGEITGIDRWGKRRLAYPINRFKEGNYVLSRFKLEPGTTAELEASLQISETILRHLLVRIES
jgi:small subunit ribosomal protein S6